MHLKRRNFIGALALCGIIPVKYGSVSVPVSTRNTVIG